MISEHVSAWLGYPVHPLGFEELDEKIPDLSRAICRLYVGYDSEGSFQDLFSRFLELPGVERTPGLIIGAYVGDDPSKESTEVVDLLVEAQSTLSSLKGIFLGDIISEENEISWINQSDVSPLFTAYPRLENLAIRGGTGLVLGTPTHAQLKSLVIQTGGLPSSVLGEIAQSGFPGLEHLELWLGEDNYGWDGTVDDLQPLIDPSLFPKLRYLGLRNSEVQDDVATLLAHAPITSQLEVLDLSLGNMSDQGGQALLGNPALKKLAKLDLHHHYMSVEMERRLQAAFPRVDVSERQKADRDGDDEYRMISVSE
jgi:hypothetical protein